MKYFGSTDNQIHIDCQIHIISIVSNLQVCFHLLNSQGNHQRLNSASSSSSIVDHLFLLGQLAGDSAGSMTGLLAADHKLESLEVGQVSTGSLGSLLLGPTGLFPLLDDLVLGHVLLQGLLTGTALQRALLGSEGQPLDRDLLSGDTGVRTRDDDTLQVDDVSDDNGLALERTAH